MRTRGGRVYDRSEVQKLSTVRMLEITDEDLNENL